jgi:hypothetical protein
MQGFSFLPPLVKASAYISTLVLVAFGRGWKVQTFESVTSTFHKVAVAA